MNNIIITLILCSLILFGCKNKSEEKQSGSNKKQAMPVTVETIIVKNTVLENKIYATGSLLANEEIELRPEISGRVTGIFFEEGTFVKKGDLLVKINDSDLKAQYKKAEVAEQQAADDEFRKKKLLEIKAISQEEYDLSLNKYKTAQAEKELLSAQIAKTQITAPFNGIVGLRYISEGGYVNANTLIARMQQIDPVKIEFSIPEKYAGMIQKNATVMFSTESVNDTIIGNVYAVEPKIDPVTRTIKVRAKSSNANMKLLPGSFAKIEIKLQQIPDALVVPAEAIIPELTGQKVFLCKGGVAKSVKVKTGIRTETGIQILDGLMVGDTLITSGILQVKNGAQLKIKIK